MPTYVRPKGKAKKIFESIMGKPPKQREERPDPQQGLLLNYSDPRRKKPM